MAAYSLVPTPVRRKAQAKMPCGRTSPEEPQIPMRRYIGQHGDLVEEEEHEEIEGDEHAVDAGHEEEEEGVELLAPLLDRPRGEHAREDDDAGEEHHEQAHAVHAQLVVDAERGHEGQLLVELEARRLALVGHVDGDGQDERDGGGDEGEHSGRGAGGGARGT